jgi:D-alanyl-D-alanine carboxypeptidase (penicillin-binding protein 5/6)
MAKDAENICGALPIKEVHVTYYVRCNLVYSLLLHVVCVLCLVSSLAAQGKDKSARPGAKAGDPTTGQRQDPMTAHAKSVVLMEALSGQILSEQHKDEKIAPASFVKLLTLYVVHDMIRAGKVKLTDEVYISKKAWETGGSKMFVDLDSKVPLEEIIKGIAVVSGNDACIAAAEHVYGSIETFVKAMNDTAQRLGMTSSHFDNPHGLPSPQQYVTAYDMAILAKNYISEFPEALKYHSILEYTYSGIKQYNRNRLLRKDSSIDGLKTGYVEEGGYHLLATAKRDERRLIAVVMGAKSPSVREEEALKLLNYGYRNFAFVSLFPKGKVLYELPVWKGKDKSVSIVAHEEGMNVIPAEQKDKITQEKFLPDYVVAPIDKGQEIGKHIVKVGQNVFKTIPYIAEKDVKRAAFPKAWLHSVFLMGKGKTILLIVVGIMVVPALVFFTVNFFNRGRRQKSRMRF